jgi:hypothetical protein
MPVLDVLIFRGTGGVLNREHPHYDEPGLVRAGHAGIAGVIDGRIIGFHPTAEAVEEAGGERELLEALSRHESQPGCLQDDTAIFERAHELSEAGERTTVYIYSVNVSDSTLATIRAWYNEQKETPYNFPDRKTGTFSGQESNCAIFWLKHFQIPLPVKTGQIKLLIDVMKEEEYEVWEKNRDES